MGVEIARQDPSFTETSIMPRAQVSQYGYHFEVGIRARPSGTKPGQGPRRVKVLYLWEELTETNTFRAELSDPDHFCLLSSELSSLRGLPNTN